MVITVCGEALIDLVSTDGVHFEAHPGGSPANVAVGLARLAVPVSFLGRLSADAMGGLLRAHLDGNGVNLRDSVAADEPTSLALAALDATGAAHYQFYVQGTADWQWEADELPDPLADDVVAWHCGSLALELEPGRGRLLALVRRERQRGAVTITFDPNVRLARAGLHPEGVAAVEAVVELAHVVKVSSDDLDWLYPGRDQRDVAHDWHEAGPDLVVVTQGPKGAFGFSERAGLIEVGAVPVEVADTVGAGDAFMAGLLAGLWHRRLLGGHNQKALRALDGHQLETLLVEATWIAALTCSRPGADPPTAAEVAGARF